VFPMSVESLLSQRLAAAFAAAAGQPVDPAVRRSQHADYQSDAALALARRLAIPPRELAAGVLKHAELADVCARVEVSGPGFINLTVSDRALAAMVMAMAGDAMLGVARPASPETAVVDYSGPNVAKEMHVGHLRSTVIGDAVVRLLEWLGHRVIRANHLGDWGTPFGMLIEHLVDLGESEAAHELSVGDLNGFYQAARAKFDTDADFAARARLRVVALQSGDVATLRLWRLLVSESQRYFLSVYDRLGVRLVPGDFVGESYYNPMLAGVVDELAALGLLRRSQGAECVFPDGFTGRDRQPLPLIVRKTDGGYGYAATDLAAIRYRTRDVGATRLVYVVGAPQHQHLAMVYQTARQAGWLPDTARAEHVAFGSVLGPDGRMLRSRAGASVKLADLLDEAVTRAADLARAKNPDLDEDQLGRVAHAVGTGAVKYADLSTDRVKDYVFDWDRMLALDGNTAPYLQYAHARIRSIFRRGAVTGPVPGPLRLTDASEHVLAVELLRFPDVIDAVAESLELHRLAGYLYGLATAFNGFYEQCPVLRAEPGLRDSRLLLCDLTGRVLRQGLCLLSITAPNEM
jgi:arginyl-tRNA synthetase